MRLRGLLRLDIMGWPRASRMGSPNRQSWDAISGTTARILRRPHCQTTPDDSLYVAESRFIWSHSSDSRFFSFASSGGHWQPSVVGTGQVTNPANGNGCWDGTPSYSRSIRFGPCRVTGFGPVGRAVSARHIAGSQRLRGSTSGMRKSRSPGRVSYFESFRPSSSRPSFPTE
jgi:hypothetical protein